MRLVNLRLGHACNSSSTHTLLIGRNVGYDRETGGEFGWQFFTAGTAESKGNYFGQILRAHVSRLAGDEVATIVAKALAPSTTADGYLDHQSMPCMPREWGDKGPDMEFAKAMRDFLLRDDVTVLGGNDNDEKSHPLGRGEALLPWSDDMAREVRARRDGDMWTLYDAESGTRVSIDFGAKSGEDYCRRSGPWEGRAIDFPWLVDVKITDHCGYGCAYCYQGSTRDGKHADAQDVGTLAANLEHGKCFEVAIGGGEPTKHPKFMDILDSFKRYGVTPNFTTRNVQYLTQHRDELEKLVGAVAVSVDNLTDAKALARAAKKMGCDDYSGGPFRLHAQIVDGVVRDVGTMRAVLADAGIKTTLLGYKTTGRGSLVKPPHLGAWRQDPKVAQRDGAYWRFPYAVDTAFLAMYRDDPMLAGALPETGDIVEGRTSCYVDLVEGFAAKSSYETTKRVPLERGRFDAETWRKVRVQA